MAKKEGVPGGGQGGRAPARHRLGGRWRHPQVWLAFFVACLPCRRGALWGARLFWSPAYPAFSFVLAPLPRKGRISPLPPFPAGRGETKVIFMQGAPPLASPGLNPWFAAKPTRIGSLRVVPSCICMAGAVSAASSLMQGCRGRSPRRNKLWTPPSPPGKGAGGIGGKIKNQRQGKQATKKVSPPTGNNTGSKTAATP